MTTSVAVMYLAASDAKNPAAFAFPPRFRGVEYHKRCRRQHARGIWLKGDGRAWLFSSKPLPRRHGKARALCYLGRRAAKPADGLRRLVPCCRCAVATDRLLLNRHMIFFVLSHAAGIKTGLDG